jgi:hypothetical protein
MSLSLLMADRLRAYADDHAATLPVDLAGLFLDSADQHVATQADLDRACRALDRCREAYTAAMARVAGHPNETPTERMRP